MTDTNYVWRVNSDNTASFWVQYEDYEFPIYVTTGYYGMWMTEERTALNARELKPSTNFWRELANPMEPPEKGSAIWYEFNMLVVLASMIDEGYYPDELIALKDEANARNN